MGVLSFSRAKVLINRAQQHFSERSQHPHHYNDTTSTNQHLTYTQYQQQQFTVQRRLRVAYDTLKLCLTADNCNMRAWYECITCQATLFECSGRYGEADHLLLSTAWKHTPQALTTTSLRCVRVEINAAAKMAMELLRFTAQLWEKRSPSSLSIMCTPLSSPAPSAVPSVHNSPRGNHLSVPTSSSAPSPSPSSHANHHHHHHHIKPSLFPFRAGASSHYAFMRYGRLIHAYDLVELMASWQQVCDHRQPSFDAALMMVMEHGTVASCTSEHEREVLCAKMSALLNSANMPIEDLDVDVDEVADMLTPESPHGAVDRRVSLPPASMHRSGSGSHSDPPGPLYPSIMSMLSEQDWSTIESYNFAASRYMDVITPVKNMLSEVDLDDYFSLSYKDANDYDDDDAETAHLAVDVVLELNDIRSPEIMARCVTACEVGNEVAVQKLIQHGINVNNIAPKCEFNHDMSYHTSPLVHSRSQTYRCNDCSSVSHCINGFYHCDTCSSYDLCPDCAKSMMHPALIVAASCGRASIVRLLVVEGHADLNVCDTEGYTALFRAVEFGHTDVVCTLISLSAENVHSPPLPPDSTLSPSHALLWAATHGQTSVLEPLITKAHASVHTRDKDGRTCLLVAAFHDHAACVATLINRYHVDVRAKDNTGRTCLHYAVVYNNVPMIHSLMLAGCDVDAVDNSWNTPLLDAAVTIPASSPEAKKLRAQAYQLAVTQTQPHPHAHTHPSTSARPSHSRSSSYGVHSDGTWSPSHHVFPEQAVKVLITQYHAELHLQTRDGLGALHLAAIHNNTDLIMMLLDEGGGQVQPNQQDQAGRTPIWHASACDSSLCVFLLIDKYHVDVSLADNLCEAPLHRCVANAHLEIMHMLCKAGASPDQPNQHGITPFIAAVQKGSLPMIQSLTSRYKASVKLIDHHGMSALLHACALGDAAVVAYLLNHGADVSLRTPSGRDAFALARQHGHMNVIQKLVEAGYPDTNPDNNTPPSPPKPRSSPSSNPPILRSDRLNGNHDSRRR